MRRILLSIILLLCSLNILNANPNSEKLVNIGLKYIIMALKGDQNNLRKADPEFTNILFNREIQDIYKDLLSYSYFIEKKDSKRLREFFVKIQNLCGEITKDLNKVDKQKLISENNLNSKQAQMVTDAIEWLRITTKYASIYPDRFLDQIVVTLTR